MMVVVRLRSIRRVAALRSHDQVLPLSLSLYFSSSLDFSDFQNG